MAKAPKLVPLPGYIEYPADVMRARAASFFEEIRSRRSVRDFSPRPVPREVMEDCLRAAGSAPCGANLQPWHFAVVESPAVKREIRLAAEEEERAFYSGRAPETWLEDLAPLGTDASKPFLETAPVLIAVFAQNTRLAAGGEKRLPNYYVKESVGIAAGVLVTALHHAGLASLTHTPSPMQFLNRILGRPASEKPFLLLVVGYPAKGARVPEITKKPLAEIASFI